MSTNDSNRAVFSRPEVVRFYSTFEELTSPERQWLEDYKDDLSGRVLDLGVGSGRTTPHFAPRAAFYVGVDYSADLVAEARVRHPDATFRVGDARQLADDDGSFDVVVFSFNGIDSVGHEDRLSILDEMHRVLRPEGLLLFSTHNRDLPGFDELRWRALMRPGRPLMSEIRRAGRLLRRHRAMKRSNVYTDNYAVVNDEGHDFMMMHYYISRASQLDQLQEAGFDVIGTSALDGTRLGTEDSQSPFLYFAARRRA